MNSKKLLFVFPLAFLLMFFASCNKESYRHQISIVYPNGGKVLYADETVDSVCFLTYDSYSVTSFNSPWVKVLNSSDYPSSKRLLNNYYSCYYVRVNLEFEPNTTQECRYGYVNIRSYDNEEWDETSTHYLLQFCWHDIAHPAPAYTYNDNRQITGCRFESKDSAMQVVDTLRFYAHDKWTLTQPEGSFVTSPVTSGNAGAQTLILAVEPNSQDEKRSVELKLKSANGPETPVIFTQEGKKK